MTRAMAGLFAEVHAVDISAEMTFADLCPVPCNSYNGLLMASCA